jgi:hypothetical protein
MHCLRSRFSTCKMARQDSKAAGESWEPTALPFSPYDAGLGQAFLGVSNWSGKWRRDSGPTNHVLARRRTLGCDVRHRPRLFRSGVMSARRLTQQSRQRRKPAALPFPHTRRLQVQLRRASSGHSNRGVKPESFVPPHHAGRGHTQQSRRTGKRPTALRRYRTGCGGEAPHLVSPSCAGTKAAGPTRDHLSVEGPFCGSRPPALFRRQRPGIGATRG